MLLTIVLLNTIVSPIASECTVLSRPPSVAARMFPSGVLERRVPEGRRQHVAREQRVILVELPVDAADRLSLSRLGRTRIRDLAARIARRRQHAGDLHRRRAEQRRIDPVVHEPERRRQREVALRAALRRGDGREVAVQHRRRRNERDDVGRRLRGARALIAPKKKIRPRTIGPPSTPPNWFRTRPSLARSPVAGLIAANGRVALKRWWRANSNRSPWNRFVPAFVATLTVPPALTPFCAFCELVSTRNSCIASGNGSGRLTPSYQLLCMRAVEQVLHAELLAAGDRDAAALSQAAARGIARVDRAAGEHDERGHVAALERQCFDRFVVDDLLRSRDCASRRVAWPLRLTPFPRARPAAA